MAVDHDITGLVVSSFSRGPANVIHDFRDLPGEEDLQLLIPGGNVVDVLVQVVEGVGNLFTQGFEAVGLPLQVRESHADTIQAKIAPRECSLGNVDVKVEVITGIQGGLPL